MLNSLRFLTIIEDTKINARKCSFAYFYSPSDAIIFPIELTKKQAIEVRNGLDLPKEENDAIFVLRLLLQDLDIDYHFELLEFDTESLALPVIFLCYDYLGKTTQIKCNVVTALTLITQKTIQLFSNVSTLKKYGISVTPEMLLEM